MNAAGNLGLCKRKVGPLGLKHNRAEAHMVRDFDVVKPTTGLIGYQHGIKHPKLPQKRHSVFGKNRGYF